MENRQLELDVMAMREALVGLLAVTARHAKNSEEFLTEVSAAASAATDGIDPRSEIARASAVIQSKIDDLLALAKLRL